MHGGVYLALLSSVIPGPPSTSVAHTSAQPLSESVSSLQLELAKYVSQLISLRDKVSRVTDSVAHISNNRLSMLEDLINALHQGLRQGLVNGDSGQFTLNLSQRKILQKKFKANAAPRFRSSGAATRIDGIDRHGGNGFARPGNCVSLFVQSADQSNSVVVIGHLVEGLYLAKGLPLPWFRVIFDGGSVLVAGNSLSPHRAI